MLKKGDVVLLVDDSPDADRGRDFARSFCDVAQELGLEARFYLTAGGAIPRQTETEFLDDVRCALVIVVYLAPTSDAKSEANRVSRVLLNTNNLCGKHVLAYSSSASSDTTWLGTKLTSGDVSDATSFKAALRHDLGKVTSN